MSFSRGRHARSALPPAIIASPIIMVCGPIRENAWYGGQEPRVMAAPESPRPCLPTSTSGFACTFFQVALNDFPGDWQFFAWWR